MTSVTSGAATVRRMEPVAGTTTTTIGGAGVRAIPNGLYPREGCGYFEMPLHYPRYTKADYETMPEWKLSCLLAEYGLPVIGDNLEQKRKFAMGAFLWPN